MGAFATHIIFGWEAEREIQDGMAASVIRSHQGIYEIGCQGPDLFLYNPAMLLSSYKKNLGSRMHVEKCGRFFACLADTIWQQSDSQALEVGLSYLLGIMAHYSVDTCLHPYVYARTGYDPKDSYADRATLGIHFRLEAAIDAKIIAAKLGFMPSSFPVEKTLDATKTEKKILAGILAKAIRSCYHMQLSESCIYQTIDMMRLIVRGFFDKSGRRKKYLSKIEFPIWEDGLFSNLFVEDAYVAQKGIMNTRNAIWYHPWDYEKEFRQSVWEIYDQAQEAYCRYVKGWKQYIQRVLHKLVFLRHMHTEYGEGLSKKEMHTVILESVKELGNLSYHSGFPIEKVL